MRKQLGAYHSRQTHMRTELTLLGGSFIGGEEFTTKGEQILPVVWVICNQITSLILRSLTLTYVTAREWFHSNSSDKSCRGVEDNSGFLGNSDYATTIIKKCIPSLSYNCIGTRLWFSNSSKPLTDDVYWTRQHTQISFDTITLWNIHLQSSFCYSH